MSFRQAYINRMGEMIGSLTNDEMAEFMDRHRESQDRAMAIVNSWRSAGGRRRPSVASNGDGTMTLPEKLVERMWAIAGPTIKREMEAENRQQRNRDSYNRAADNVAAAIERTARALRRL